jgi:anti-sigma factor RsiW
MQPPHKLPVRHGHPRPPALSQYLDGELAPRERLAMEAHLRDCHSCRGVLASLSQTIQALGSLPAEHRPGMADSIIAALRRESPQQDGATERSSRAMQSPALRVVRSAAEPSITRRAPAGWPPRAHAALRYCLRRVQLRLTLPIALLVGVALSLINQGDMIFNGRLTVGMCASCALNFVVPFIALNIGLAMAMRVTKSRRI